MAFWLWQLSVTAVIGAVGVIYVRGWRRLQRYPLANSAEFRRATHFAFGRFFIGLILAVIALISPLHALAGQYFSLRVAQNLLLVAWIPSLVLSANPLPVLYQGLPRPWRARLAQRRPLPAIVKEAIHFFTAPGAVLLTFAAVFWLWFDPMLHQASVNSPIVRGIEELTLLSVALLYWWHITAALPRFHQPLPWLVRVVYTFLGVFMIKLVGLIVMFSSETFYVYPATFQLSGLQIDDYLMGGIIFWVVGGGVYATTALLLLRRWLAEEEAKPGLPESAWATEEAMLAPGLKK